MVSLKFRDAEEGRSAISEVGDVGAGSENVGKAVERTNRDSIII